jgi:hypothetical protein
MDTTSEDVIGFVRKRTQFQRNYRSHALKAKSRRHERRKVREALHQFAHGFPELE